MQSLQQHSAAKTAMTQAQNEIRVETENHAVIFTGEKTDEHGHTTFHYEVLYSSYECGVNFIYMPIDDDPDDEGFIWCDVDVHVGGDCVGVPTAIECLQVAWGVHQQLNVAARFRMTEG